MTRLPSNRFDFDAYPNGLNLRALGGDSLPEGPTVNDYVTVIVVEEGEGYQLQGGRSWRADAGSVFVVATGEVHNPAGLAQLRGWVLSFVPSALAPRPERDDVRLPRPGDLLWLLLLRPACLRCRLSLPVDSQTRWRHRLEELHDELAASRPNAPAAARALTSLIVIDAARLILPEAGETTAAHSIIGDTFSYIEDHFADPISLDDVAQALARSPANLARIVRRATGRTVNTWIAERRMAEARRLLAVSDGTVDVVARNVGYTDVSYFRRRFREHHGTAPGEYRRRVRDREGRFTRTSDRMPR